MRDLRKLYARLFPELGYFDSHDAAKSALREAWKPVRRAPRFWAVTMLYLVAVPTLLEFVVIRLAVPRSMIGGIIGGVMGGSGFAVLKWAFREPIRRNLRERLAELGVPICIPCGYDLRGQTEPRCPECRASFDSALLRPRADGEAPTPA